MAHAERIAADCAFFRAVARVLWRPRRPNRELRRIPLGEPLLGSARWRAAARIAAARAGPATGPILGSPPSRHGRDAVHHHAKSACEPEIYGISFAGRDARRHGRDPESARRTGGARRPLRRSPRMPLIAGQRQGGQGRGGVRGAGRGALILPGKAGRGPLGSAPQRPCQPWASPAGAGAARGVSRPAASTSTA